MRHFIVLLLLALGCASPALALDRFTITVGGSGGNQYRLRCPAGAIMTGVTGRTGAYVDQIGPVCEGGARPGLAGRNASNVKEAICPQGSVVSQVTIRTLRSDNHLVDSLLLQCVARNNRGTVTASLPYYTPTGPNDRTVQDLAKLALAGPIGILFGPQGSSQSGRLACEGEDVVGLQGRAGASVDAVGLICGTATTTVTASAGARLCKSGYVWRNAFDGDAVCVTPAIRSQTAQENALGPTRSVTRAVGGYCVSGFVWRTTRPTDLVCVTPASRSQAQSDNAQAGARVQ